MLLIAALHCTALQECELGDLLRLAAKKGIGRGLVIHNAETGGQ